MAAKGLISEAQIDAQVTDIMKYNDAGFESMKTIVAKQPSMSKQASMPQVGLLDSGAVILPAASPMQKVASSDIKGFFDSYFGSKPLGKF
jgi:hypothetical protein